MKERFEELLAEARALRETAEMRLDMATMFVDACELLEAVFLRTASSSGDDEPKSSTERAV